MKKDSKVEDATLSSNLKQKIEVVCQSHEFGQMQKYSIRLDVTVVQLKATYAQEKGIKG